MEDRIERLRAVRNMPDVAFVLGVEVNLALCSSRRAVYNTEGASRSKSCNYSLGDCWSTIVLLYCTTVLYYCTVQL